MDTTQWPRLARDLAILTAPDAPFTMDDVKKEYGLSDEELSATARSPAFLAIFDREVEAVLKAGDKAGARYRAMALSGALAEKLFKDAVTGGMEHRESVKLLELLLKASGVMEAERPVVAVQNNVRLRLPLPRIPKLAHALPEGDES